MQTTKNLHNILCTVSFVYDFKLVPIIVCLGGVMYSSRVRKNMGSNHN